MAGSGGGTPPAFDPDLEHWERRVYETRIGQLGILRAYAEKWRTGIIALTGLLSAASVVAAPKLSEINADARVQIIGLGIGGLVILIIGVALAMRASIGIPGRKVLLLPQAIRDWEIWESKVSRVCIILSLVFTLVGLSAILGATAISALNLKG